MTAPRKGDKVHVTFDAEYVVSGVPGTSVQAYVNLPDGAGAVVPHGATIEPIEDDLQHLDIVLDADDQWFRKVHTGWQRFGWTITGFEPKRPFKVHIRDGEVLS